MDAEKIKSGLTETATGEGIGRLPEQLGFVETDELRAVKEEAVAAVQADNWPLIHQLRSQYMKLGEEIVERLEGEAFERCKLGLTIATATIMRDGGRINNFADELQNAHLHALNQRFDNEAAVIRAVLAEAGQEPEYKPLHPSREKPKREISEDYRSELERLAAGFEPLRQPMEVSMDDNHLIVDGRTLEASDGPSFLYHALTDGAAVITEGLYAYQEKMKSANPEKEISPDTPLRLMYLADYPRDVLTETGMEKIDHSQREFHDIDDVRPEFRELWMAVDASGRLAEIRLFATRLGWDPVYLWARKQATDE